MHMRLGLDQIEACGFRQGAGEVGMATMVVIRAAQ
jgi:hypothetical protein